MFYRVFAIAVFCFASMMSPSTGWAQNGAVKVFEEKQGPWTASCFRDANEPAPYCRIMAIKLIGPDGMAMNFAQFGPAWDRGQSGLVIATYLGFARKSSVSLQVDDMAPWTVKAPDTNHVITPQDLTPVILNAMEKGQKVTLTFKPANGGEETVSAELSDYRTLAAAVQKVLSQETDAKPTN